ncbi:cupin-like domain containing protein [Nitzschia inconspicua]|uniref:Cupin-like domain containing protein n=1 Tax=Nitzschia inconspicua TaxID=303405 RepID=A0A9K3PDG0_9STRA|nr:cupin-like domain containing protein [Nitzschia inconspicua]
MSFTSNNNIKTVYGDGKGGTSKRKVVRGQQDRLRDITLQPEEDDHNPNLATTTTSSSSFFFGTCHPPTASHGGDMTGKRRRFGSHLRHRRRQRLQQSLRLFLAAIFLLVFTTRVLYQRAYNKHHHRQSATTPKSRGFGQERDDGDDGSSDTSRRKYQPGQPLHHPELEGHLLQPKVSPRRRRRIGRGGGGDLAHSTPQDDSGSKSDTAERLQEDFQHVFDVTTERIYANLDQGIRWVNPGMVPPLETGKRKPMLEVTKRNMIDLKVPKQKRRPFFTVSRPNVMAWQVEDQAKRKNDVRPDFVDYTQHRYHYPELLLEPPTILGQYPKLQPLRDIMNQWPQDELDHPPETIPEVLMHFDYNQPEQLQAAKRFRDAKLPFKLVNVPEVMEAGQKWTDEYLTVNFDGGYGTNGPPAEGTAEESVDNFFAFFVPHLWSVPQMGLPPTFNNDWTFARWAQHARYADRVGLSPHRPHFYWQAGVSRDERKESYDRWTFISRDLPSFSSPTETFFLFEPQQQKGIQCRFGERGVTAATHYDNGRNMVAMITGAKRYILSPPRECRKLGIVTKFGNAMYRHSMLNLGHLAYLNNSSNTTEGMPNEERAWLGRAATATSLSTVLKAGEVLYIPSFWFHYIVGLQKNAQCNVRSGVDPEGDMYFGGKDDVIHQCDLDKMTR